jgi:hypothetical protein
MGLRPDGETVKAHFDPNGYVTRAEFGTVLSRLLYGKTYSVENVAGINRYVKHLQGLKDHGIMTKIDVPMMKELRGYVMLMMMRAAKDSVHNAAST